MPVGGHARQRIGPTTNAASLAPVEVADVTLLFGILALILGGFLLVLAICWLAARDLAVSITDRCRPFATELAASIAVVCTLGSLYLSEVAEFDPCYLCWVQRYFMYPAAVLLVVALVTGWTAPVKISAGLAALGLPVAIFHRLEQEVGEIGDFCEATNPCGGKWVEEFGFVTIPTMAAVGFLGVLFFCLLSLSSSRAAGVEAEEPELV